ncbi:MAG: FAD-binding oxidoreductase [Desulfobacterales bacterium]
MRTLSIMSKDGTGESLSTDTVDHFKDNMRGDLIIPEDDQYESARKLWNGMIDKKPALIARCTGVEDVVTAVNFSKEHNLLFSIRSGGHNVAGTAIAEGGLVVDLSAMRNVTVDPDRRMAHAEGGVRLGDLDRETQKFNLAVPVGVVSATGVAGLTLHGGTGWLLRKHGLTIDNLLSVDIVTADGQLKKASENENSDLFWAIRGGGGNFGVVTGFEFKLHPVGPKVWMSVPMYPLERAKEVMSACCEYMQKAPEDLMVLGVYWSAPEVPEVPARYHGTPVVILLGCYTGPFEEGEKVIAPLREIGTPIADLSAPMTWVEAQQFLDEDYPDGAFYYWKSIYMDHLDSEVLEALSRHTAARPSSESSIDVWMLKGAMSRINPGDTAFFKRDAPYMLGIEANWHKREDATANIDWAKNVVKDMQRFTKGGSYLNFPGFVEEREALLQGSYGTNLERLRAIKAKYDPLNFFPGILNIEPK